MRLLKLWLPVALWAALILSASNDSFSADETGGFLARLFGGEIPFVVHYAIRKGGHLVAYGILGALAFRANRRLAVAFVVVLLVAAIDETNQGMTRLRTGSVWDVLLDLAGAALAIIAVPAARARLSSRRSGGRRAPTAP
ncbi:MAG TPA: VanZ family protein [Thermoanaerobaculia bacterium]